MSIDSTVIVPILVQGLQGPSAKKFVQLTIDFVLQQPLRNIVPLTLVQNQVTMLLQTLVQSEQTQEWLVHQIVQAQSIVPEGTPGDYVSPSIQEPLRRALQQEIPVDTELVHQMMDHPAMEQLFHDVLSSVLLDFTDTIKTWTQAATSATSNMRSKTMGGGFGRLKALGEKMVQNTPLGQITQIIEQQAQQKILHFLDQSIASIIRRSAQEVGKVENQAQQSVYRIHVLDVLLSTDNQRLMDQFTVFEPTFIVETITQTTQAILELPSFQEQLQVVLAQLLETIGDQSVHDFLVESDLGDDWRVEIEDYLVSMAHQIVAEPTFSEILTGMLSGENESPMEDDR
jgi:hypothetical protein